MFLTDFDRAIVAICTAIEARGEVANVSSVRDELVRQRVEIKCTNLERRLRTLRGLGVVSARDHGCPMAMPCLKSLPTCDSCKGGPT